MTTPQAAPSTAAAPTSGPESAEQKWLREVYRGDSMPQLTFRAVFMGLILGSLMAFSNLYVGLKTGWGLGVAITACIMSWAIFRVLRGVLGEPSILENNCMQSTASAAGYSTGSTLVSAFSAQLMLSGTHLPWYVTMLMVGCLAFLGVFMAIPMKRNMINVEQLPFPSGTAAAETLRSLYSSGAEAARKARLLFLSMGAGGVVAWWRDGFADLADRFKLVWAEKIALPSHLPLHTWLRSAGFERAATFVDPKGYTFSFEMSSIMLAAGAIMGRRAAVSMLVGAVVCYGVLAPIMANWPTGVGDAMVIPKLGYRSIVAWSVWGGVSMMTTAALFNFFMQWDTVKRSFSELGSVFSGKKNSDDPMAAIEVPATWFAGGSTVATIGCVIALWWAFDINPLLGLLSVVISFVLAIVACRATGETDTTPIGALGKITQLTYGVLIPQNMTANLMTANVTSSIAISSADLLTDLKSGYLLGANPRKQFWAQFAGVFAGTLVAVPGFYLLVPQASMLGGEKFPAPAAQVWKAVAELLAKGIEALHPTALWSMVIGGVVGILITILEKKYPNHKHLIPSPTGMGLAFVIPAWNSISMCLGAVIGDAIAKARKEEPDNTVIPVASGLIAGESLVGVAIAVFGVVYGLLTG
jgi:OPT family oligopeptide transporter